MHQTRKTFGWLTGVALLLAGAAVPAHANLTSYSTLPLWTSATSGAITNVTIPDPSPDPFTFLGSGDASVTYSGVTFSTSSLLSDGNFFNIGPGFSGDPAVLSSQEQTTGVANILITLPSSTSALSLNFDTFTGAGATFLLSNGDSLSSVATLGGTGYATDLFFGVTDTTPFNTVLITASDSVGLNIDNIAYTSATPEPALYGVLGLGLSGLIVAVRRRRA